MSATRSCRAVAFAPLVAVALAWPTASRAQQTYEFDLSALDPAAAALLAEDVLLRAPDADIDRLFQAVHVASRDDDDAQVLCTLFDPGADRSPASLQRAANGLGPASRDRFVDALAFVAIAGLQNPRQPYDAAAARQVVKSAGAKAMMLHDGFTAGLAAQGNDVPSRDARCRSLRLLVQTLDGFALHERAAATRHLLGEGLALYRDGG